MVTDEIEAILEDESVIVLSQEHSDILLQAGYGTPRETDIGSVLSPYEALYLLSDKRIRVMDNNAIKNLDFQALLQRFLIKDNEAWTKYLVYRDLRSRGYVVRKGFGYGISFRVYGRGEYGEKAAKYIVLAICEGNPVLIDRLVKTLHSVRSVKKELVLAVVDRRGEIVYYSMRGLSFRRS